MAAVLIDMSACGENTEPISSSSGPTTNSPYAEKFHHVVVIFQENRTPDNLFHGLPNADIATSGVNSHGQSIPLTSVPLDNNYDLDHSHKAFVEMYDGGKMDGADRVAVSCAANATNCPPPNPQFCYVNPSDVVPYFQLATQYTFADRMFQTNQGPSFPAHQFIIAGTSAPSASSPMFASENPYGTSLAGAGCVAPAGSLVALIDPSGNESSRTYPCFEHLTLLDFLDSKAIGWRYYAPGANSIWTAPNSIEHIRTGTDWANVTLNQKQVLTDIADCSGEIQSGPAPVADGARSLSGAQGPA